MSHECEQLWMKTSEVVTNEEYALFYRSLSNDLAKHPSLPSKLPTMCLRRGKYRAGRASCFSFWMLVKI